MDLNGKKLILASASPRRRELLAGLDLDFEVDTRNNFIERYEPGTPHREIPAVLSRGKSEGFHRPLADDEILLTSDTLVLCGEEVMGKPQGREDALRMLRLLSDGWHEVITAVTVRSNSYSKTLSDVAKVHFKALTDSELEYYVDKYRPFDKAGAYGIQEWIGYVGIDRIEGSFYTIMGLPVHLVHDLLSEAVLLH